MLPRTTHQLGFFLVVLTLACGQVRRASAQDGTESSNKTDEARPKTARPRLADLRGDEDASPPANPAPKVETKPAAEKEPNPVGFFGDTRKFTRMGGWGSFGNAMGQFGFARATLIAMPPVQEELKLTDEQKKKLKAWQEDMRKKGEAMGRSMREKNGDDPFKAGENQPIATRIFQFTSLMNQFSTFIKENEASLAKILTAPQRKRLNQIALQMEGVSALVRPEIAEELGLLDEDVAEIQQILNQSRAQQMTTWIGSMMAMRPPRKPAAEPKAEDSTKPANPAANAENNPDPKSDTAATAKTKADREKAMKQGFETMRDRTDQIQAKAVKEVINVLSRAQRARFEILLGPPFDPKKLNNLGRPPRQDGPEPPAGTKPASDEKP